MARRAALGTIFLTIFIDLVGFGMIIPLIALYGRSLGATPTELVILGGTYSIMQFLFAPFWGALSDRVGRRPVLLFSISGSVCAMLLFGLANSIWMLIVCRALAGIFAANLAAAQAYVADITTPEKRAAGMGLVGAAFGLGFTLGPPLRGVLAYYYGLSAPGFAAAALSACNLVLAFFVLGESLPESERAQRVPGERSWLHPQAFKTCRAHPVLGYLVLLFFVVTFAFSNFEQSFILHFRDVLHLADNEAGFYAALVLGWIGVVGVIIQGGLIKGLVKRFGEPLLIHTGLALYVVSFCLFPCATSYGAFFVPATLLAIGSSILSPSLSSLTSRNTPAQQQGAVLGLSQGMGSLARALGPMTGLWLYHVHFSYPFLLASLISLILVASSTFNPLQRVEVPTKTAAQ